MDLAEQLDVIGLRLEKSGRKKRRVSTRRYGRDAAARSRMLVSLNHTARSRPAKKANRPGPDGFSVADLSEPYMRAVMNRFRELIRDDAGGEVLEYALIAGLISVAAISVIGAFGGKVMAKWSSVNSSL